jgi:protein-tyrosine phosphatase
VHLLFVCAANVCRSPVAERLALAWAQEALGPGAGGLTIASAGVQARIGEPMDPYSAAALLRLGGDPSGATARALTAETAGRADLVLTMTRQQRSRVLELAPRGLRHTFTLIEAAELLDLADLDGLEHLTPPERVRELAVRLDRARAHHRDTESDDIEDPAGRRAGVHNRVAETVADAVDPLIQVLCSGTREAERDPDLG